MSAKCAKEAKLKCVLLVAGMADKVNVAFAMGLGQARLFVQHVMVLGITMTLIRQLSVRFAVARGINPVRLAPARALWNVVVVKERVRWHATLAKARGKFPVRLVRNDKKKLPRWRVKTDKGRR